MHVLILLALFLAAPLRAQTVCSEQQTWRSEPVAKDTYGCRFMGRTLSSATAEVEVRKANATDSTPTTMVTAGPTVSGDTVSLTIYPDQGCGSSGCRSGNEYQVRIKATDASGNTPTCNACLVVRKQVLRAPETR